MEIRKDHIDLSNVLKRSYSGEIDERKLCQLILAEIETAPSFKDEEPSIVKIYQNLSSLLDNTEDDIPHSKIDEILISLYEWTNESTDSRLIKTI